MMLYYPLT